jgi:ribosomal protein S21
MSIPLVEVNRKKNESIESLINRFRSKVASDGIIKDYKLNVMFSREEREKFKKFSNKRRIEKKNKRIKEAINRVEDYS